MTKNSKIYPADLEIKMVELARSLKYEYKNLKYLKVALDRNPIVTEYNSENYVNSSLATLGDRVLSLVITEIFYHKGMSKGKITKDKENIENNEYLKKFKDTFDIKQYAFKKDYYAFEDEESGREKVSIGGHEEFIEAIIGAIYLDRGIRYVKKWILQNYM